MTHLRLASTAVLGLQLFLLLACKDQVLTQPGRGDAGPETGGTADLGSGELGPTDGKLPFDLDVDVTLVPIDAAAIDGASAAKLTMEPASAELTASSIGSALPTPGPPVIFSLLNVGESATGTLWIELAGPGSSFLKIIGDTCNGAALPPRQSCAVTVVYAPLSAAGPIAGTLVVTDTASGESVTAMLTSVSWVGDCLMVHGGPDLGSVAPGAIGPEVLFQVTGCPGLDNGAITADILHSLVRISSNTCTSERGPTFAEPCFIGLQLAPPIDAAPGPFATVLTVKTALESHSLAVTGVVASSGPSQTTPPSIAFGVVVVGQSATRTLSVTNYSSTTPTGPLSVSLSGMGAAQVSIIATTCSGPLPPMSSCQVTVQYVASDTTGVLGTIHITDGSTAITTPMVGTAIVPVYDASVETGLDLGGG